MDYKVVITPKMRAVEDLLMEAFVGMNHCISEMKENLIVETPKGLCEAVRAELKKHFRDVALIKNAYPLIEDLHDFILVKPLISESPRSSKMACLFLNWRNCWLTTPPTRNLSIFLKQLSRKSFNAPLNCFL